jgi:hypothetical protein
MFCTLQVEERDSGTESDEENAELLAIEEGECCIYSVGSKLRYTPLS